MTRLRRSPRSGIRLDLISLGGRDGSPEHLNQLTLHSAKGCEYDVVIMAGMDMRAMPWRNETAGRLAEAAKALAAPRKRTAIYDGDRIVGAVDEAVDVRSVQR
jgi:superfamily I DNA/RNA helicase